MAGSVTVSVKSVLVAGLVLMGLLTAYLLGGGGAPTGEAARAAAPEQPAPGDRRVVRMTGNGEAGAVPDQLSFSLSVSAKRVDLDAALDSASATMRRTLAALEPYGVARDDVQTTGLNMYPEYDYHSYGPPTLTGYRVTQRARVLVPELEQGGRAISAAVEAGGNGVRATDIRLEVGDPAAVLDRARDAAVEEATAKAEQYAAATGQALGDVVSIREVGPGRQGRAPVYSLRSAQAAYLDGRALPIKAGKDELAVQIEVVWEFE